MTAVELPPIHVPDDLRDLHATAAPREVVRQRTPVVTPVVVRHVSPSSVARTAAVVALCAWVASLLASVLLWVVAEALGVVGGIQGFLRDVGLDGFRFLPLELLAAVAVAGLVLAAAGTATAVALTVVFNRVSDVTGGLRITLADDLEAASTGA